MTRALHPRAPAEPHPVLDDVVDDILTHPERAITCALLASAVLVLLGRVLREGTQS